MKNICIVIFLLIAFSLNGNAQLTYQLTTKQALANKDNKQHKPECSNRKSDAGKTPLFTVKQL